MRVKRAEGISQMFAKYLNNSVCVDQASWTHENIRYNNTNGIPETDITLSFFVYKQKCCQKKFKDLDEVEDFINQYIESREILFRRFA